MKVTLLRTPETQKAYEEHMKLGTTDCFMCKEEGITFGNEWKIIPNQFPYDAIAEKHDLLVLTNHTIGTYSDASYALSMMKELLFKIQGYDAIIENAPANRSVPGHYHLHLIKYKTV